MTEYKLTKESKKQKPINLDKLLVAKLFTVDKDPYYINTKGSYLAGCMTDLDGNVKFFEIPNTRSIIEPKTIIINKPRIIIDVYYCPDYVKEFMTGVKIPFAHVIDTLSFECNQFNRYALETNHKELDMFVCLDTNPRNPTQEELEKYMNEKKSIDTYKFYLETEKELCKNKHKEMIKKR